MSGALISFNPWLMTVAENAFSVETNGVTQGFILDDPVINPTQVQSALVGSGNTAPLIGGWPVEITLGSLSGRESMQNIATLATSNSNINGFTVFTYAENGVIVPGSDAVPLYGYGGTINWAALGSRARIALQASSALIDSLAGSAVNTQISWNFSTNMADVYNSTTGALPIKEINGVYAGNSLVAQQVNGVWKFVVGNAIVVTI